jgi:hypothetical protein
MTLLLYKPKEGRLVNHKESVYRIVRVNQQCLPFPGGKNVYEATLERICDGPLTRRQLADLHKAFKRGVLSGY